MVELNVNWWAVVFAAVLNMVVGALWYSPVLFGKYWAKLTGIKMDKMAGKSPAKAYGITTAAALLQTLVLAVIISNLGANSTSDGASLGLLLWLGVAATTSISDYLFTGRRLLLWAINQGYYLVVLMANGAILAVWH
jgi:hypothetical protein